MNDEEDTVRGGRGDVSPVYGPVRSWRFGRSLGIDPIGALSTCSFNCIYCQLGEIQVVTSERREFIPTPRLIEDLKKVDWEEVDVVTFSGSGEPTLATNLGEMIHHIKTTYQKPVHILTNATLFQSAEVRGEVLEADVIACKLDAASDEMLRKFNRPAGGISLNSIVDGIMKL
ncbi:radical SAM protein, partial [Candidatus Sumerlaeota bacterium]|nr:radical SAM protein [Candidatus Sumerlaeota bacterium]